MVVLKRNKHGDRYFEVRITSPIKVYVPKEFVPDEVNEEQAADFIWQKLDHLAGANDGSEFLANAKTEIINDGCNNKVSDTDK